MTPDVTACDEMLVGSGDRSFDFSFKKSGIPLSNGGCVCLVTYKGEMQMALSALNLKHSVIFILESLVHPQNCTPLSTYWVNVEFAQSNFVLKLVNCK